MYPLHVCRRARYYQSLHSTAVIPSMVYNNRFLSKVLSARFFFKTILLFLVNVKNKMYPASNLHFLFHVHLYFRPIINFHLPHIAKENMQVNNMDGLELQRLRRQNQGLNEYDWICNIYCNLKSQSCVGVASRIA